MYKKCARLDGDCLPLVCNKSLVALKDYDVEVILPPRTVEIPLLDGVKLTDAGSVLPKRGDVRDGAEFLCGEGSRSFWRSSPKFKRELHLGVIED